MSTFNNEQLMAHSQTPFNINKKSLLRWVVLLFIGLLNSGLIAQPCSSLDPSIPENIIPISGPNGASSPCGDGFGKMVSINSMGASEFDVDVDGLGSLVHIVISVGPCGEVLTWSAASNLFIDRIGVKGNSVPQNIFDYPNRVSTDGNLHAPVKDAQGGLYAELGILHICYHYCLNVSKTANTSYKRTYNWGIENICVGPVNLTLSTDEVYTYPTTWSVTATPTDSDWKVTGTISIINNTPLDATIESVNDLLSGGESGVIDCGGSFPLTLVSGASLSCAYTSSLLAPYNGINTVTVTTSTPDVSGNSATAPFIFRDPTNVVDECITVDNNCQTPTNVCVTDLDNGTYGNAANCSISYSQCGEYSYTNTVSFTTNDTESTGSDNCAVSVMVPCGGCTLSMGYWKTHSIYGPAPYDNTWALKGENTVFFLSGKTWYQTLWTPPAGNAYYILAQQYIAVQLNLLNGASIPPAVLTAFNSATTLFNTYTPAQIAILSGSNALRKQFILLATALENYNTGITGPGHCTEMNGGDSQNREVDPVSDDFSLYPNPASQLLNIDLSSFMDQSVELVMYNQLGSIVLVRHIQQVDTAIYTLMFDKVLPNGYYNVSLITAGNRLTKSLIIAN